MGHFKNERVVKTTEITKIISIQDLDVNINERDVTPDTITFDGKFTSLQLDRLAVVYQCLICNSEVDIEDEMDIWDHCSTASAKSQCSNRCKEECTVMNADTKVKYNVVVPQKILKELVSVLVEEKIPFVRLLSKGTYPFKINTQSNTVLTFFRITK